MVTASAATTAPSVSAAVAAASAAAAAISASVARRSEADERPSKRRNRWGGVAGAAAGQPADTATRGLALPETQDSVASRQLKVQREMQLLEQRIRDAAQRDGTATDSADLQDERRVWRAETLWMSVYCDARGGVRPLSLIIDQATRVPIPC